MQTSTIVSEAAASSCASDLVFGGGCVPLAQLDEFSEDTTPVTPLPTQASTSSSSSTESTDSSSPSSQAGSSASSGRVGCKRAHKAPTIKGTLTDVSSLDQHVEINGYGLPDSHKQTDSVQNVRCYEDLEKIFMGQTQDVWEGLQGEQAGNEAAGVSHSSSYPLVNFAEKYFNEHYVGAGYPAAITKTVSLMRRKSLPVSTTQHYAKTLLRNNWH